MPRNKRDIDAQLKRDHIVAQATRLWLAHGFDDTSMAAIAREAGIAPNTIYWYFAGKDDLLVAAMDRITPELAQGYVGAGLPTVLERLTWLINQLQAYNPLVQAIHARLAHSEVVRVWHDRYHQSLEGLLTAHLLKQGVPPERAPLMATVGTFVFEGLLSHPHTQAQQQAILAWMAEGR